MYNFLKDMAERIRKGTDQYIQDRCTKSIGAGDTCPMCGGATVAYEGMDECPGCQRFFIKRMGRRISREDYLDLVFEAQRKSVIACEEATGIDNICIRCGTRFWTKDGHICEVKNDD